MSTSITQEGAEVNTMTGIVSSNRRSLVVNMGPRAHIGGPHDGRGSTLHFGGAAIDAAFTDLGGI